MTYRGTEDTYICDRCRRPGWHPEGHPGRVPTGWAALTGVRPDLSLIVDQHYCPRCWRDIAEFTGMVRGAGCHICSGETYNTCGVCKADTCTDHLTRWCVSCGRRCCENDACAVVDEGSHDATCTGCRKVVDA